MSIYGVVELLERLKGRFFYNFAEFLAEWRSSRWCFRVTVCASTAAGVLGLT